MIFMKASLEKEVRCQGVNPHFILLNEVFTRQGTDIKQFVELRRASNFERISLHGYSLIVCETTSNKNIKPNLALRSVIDLSQGFMDAGQSYGTIGDNTALGGASHIQSFLPGITTKVIPRDMSPKKKGSVGDTFDNINDWLTVDQHRTMLVFLLYSADAKVFDQDVWNMINQKSKALTGK